MHEKNFLLSACDCAIFLFYLHTPAGREQMWAPDPISNFFKHCYRSSLQMTLAGHTDLIMF